VRNMYVADELRSLVIKMKTNTKETHYETSV